MKIAQVPFPAVKIGSLAGSELSIRAPRSPDYPAEAKALASNTAAPIDPR